jgi:hypothetical protein
VDGPPGARVGGRLAQPQEARVVVAGGGHHCRPRRPGVELHGGISHVAEKSAGSRLRVSGPRPMGFKQREAHSLHFFPTKNRVTSS